MTINEKKKKLDDARMRQRILRKEIDALREDLRDHGIDPDVPKNDVTPRNKEIYKQWKDGKTFKELAKEYKLSTATISSACNRIERTLEVKGHHYHKYKDLLKYK